MTIDPRYFAAYQKNPAPKMPRKKPVQRERKLQTQIVVAIRTAFPETFVAALPNGGSRNKIEAALMKAAGGVAGLPDLMLIPVGPGGVGFMEIKVKVTKSSVSPAQRDFAQTCEAYGIPWCVVDSVEGALEAVMRMKGLRT